jgi:hypothetical protein
MMQPSHGPSTFSSLLTLCTGRQSSLTGYRMQSSFVMIWAYLIHSLQRRVSNHTFCLVGSLPRWPYPVISFSAVSDTNLYLYLALKPWGSNSNLDGASSPPMDLAGSPALCPPRRTARLHWTIPESLTCQACTVLVGSNEGRLG